MEKYRQEDLYRVMNALNEAVIDSKFDVAKSEIQELNTILSNVWDDAKRLVRERNSTPTCFH